MATDKLKDVQIRQALPAEKVMRLFDGGGLYLEIKPDGGKFWRLKYRFASRENRLTFGRYPEVSLRDARDCRDEARRLLSLGADPSAARKDAKAAALRLREAKDLDDAGLPPEGSFEAVAREWLSTVHVAKVSEGHAERTTIRLETDMFPWLGRRQINDIRPPELLECFRRIEARGAIETAHRIKQACGQVFRYAIATGRRDTDPTADLREALTPVHKKHRAAITDPKRTGELLRAIDAYTGHFVTRAALALSPLLFQRPGELRSAEWAEIDMDAATWTIPSERMKRSKQAKLSGPAHLVPLSRQALAVLRELQPLTGRGRYVFPGLRTHERPMSNMAVLAALRRMGFTKEEMTVHGFRAMARTMLAERLGTDEATIEAQLAHSVRDSLGRAYNRTAFLDQRRKMMQHWANYLDRLRKGDDEAPMRPTRRGKSVTD
jgi:integrase